MDPMRSPHSHDSLPMSHSDESDDAVLADGLAAVIDRALARHPAGETFVYGIHQQIGPAAMERLRARFTAAGWSRVSLREGATGAYLLVLSP